MNDDEQSKKPILGLDRRRRMKIYGWATLVAVIAAMVAAWIYLRPDRWYKYTDQVAFEQVAQDVELGFVLWENSSAMTNVIDVQGGINEPAISSDGSRMVYTTGTSTGNANLFIRRWDGNQWGSPRPVGLAGDYQGATI